MPCPLVENNCFSKLLYTHIGLGGSPQLWLGRKYTTTTGLRHKCLIYCYFMRLFWAFIFICYLWIDAYTRLHTNICYEGAYLLTFLLECNITVELFLNPLLCSFLWKIYGSLPYLAVSYWSNIGPNKTLMGSVNNMCCFKYKANPGTLL